MSLVLNSNASDAAAKLHRLDGELLALDDDTCRYSAYVDSYEWLAVVMVLSEVEFTVESPAEFAEYLARQTSRLQRAHGLS